MAQGSHSTITTAPWCAGWARLRWSACSSFDGPYAGDKELVTSGRVLPWLLRALLP